MLRENNTNASDTDRLRLVPMHFQSIIEQCLEEEGP